MSDPANDLDILDTPAAGPAAIRGGALRMGAYVAGILLSLISAPLLIGHLGVVDFGRYVLVTAVLGVAGGILDAGLLGIAQREYIARSGEDRDRTMANLFGLRLTLVSAAVLLAIAFSAIAGYGGAVTVGMLLAGCAALLAAIGHIWVTPIVAELRYGITTGMDLAGQVLTVVLMVLLVLAGASFVPFLAIGIPISAVMAVVTARLVRGRIPLKPTFHRREWFELLRDSIPFAAAAAVTALYYRLGLIVLSLISTDLQTGYYATASRIYDVVLGVPSMLVGAAFPVLTRAADTIDRARLAYQISRIYEVAVVLGLWLALALVLGAPFIVDFIAGEVGDPVVPVLRIQAPAIVATFFAVGSAFPLLALRRHREVLVASTAGLAVGIVAAIVLGDLYGARGAAASNGIAELLLAGLMVRQLRRAVPDAALPLRTAALALPLAALALCLTFVPVHSIVQVAAGTAVYFGGLLVLGRVPEEIGDALGLRARFARRRS